MNRIAAVGLGVLVFACGSDPAEPDEDVLAELEAPGPYAVGFKIVDVEYTPPLATAPRTLSTLAWYPAEPTGTEEAPTYLLRTSELAKRDAPPRMDEPRPVIVFSHGHQAYAAVMSHLLEHFASHGFIALAPNHTGNTFLDGEARETEIYYQRPLDISAVLDALDGLASEIGPASEDRIVLGHSFGGYTAYALLGARFDMDTLSPKCSSGEGPEGFCSTLTPEKEALFRDGLADSRFAAAIAIEAGDFDLYGESGARAVDRPSLHMTAEMSEPDPYVSALEHDTWIRLLGGAHNDFVDSCGYGVKLRCSELPPTEVRRGVAVFSLAYARSVLFSDARMEPILSGQLPVSSGLFELGTAP